MKSDSDQRCGIASEINESNQAKLALQAYADQLTTILAAQRQIAVANLDYPDFLKFVLECMTRLCGAEGATLEVADGSTLVYEVATGLAAPFVGMRLKIAQSLSGLCMQHGEVMRTDDSEADIRVDREACRRIGIRSMILLPLRYSEDSFGVLKLLSSSTAAFSPNTEQILNLMGEFLSATIARKRTEVSLRESEAKYRLLSENSGDVIWLFDLASNRFSYVSPSVTRLRGFSVEEVLSQGMSEALTPESYQRVAEALPGRLAAMEAGDEAARVQIHEMDQVRKDGSVVPTEVVTTLIMDAGRRVVHIQGVSRDITERKKAESIIRDRLELQDQFVKVAASVPGAICSFKLRPDGSGCLPFATEAIKDLYGLRPEDVREDFSPLLALVNPEDREHVQQSIAESAHTMHPWHCVYGIQHPHKGRRWIEGHSMPRREPDGSTLWHGFVHDITEKKEAELLLQQSEARRKLALDAAQAGTWEWDLPTNRSVWSDELWQLFGLEPHSCEPSYEAWREAVHPDDRERVERSLRDAVQRGDKLSLEWRVNSSGNCIRWLMSRGQAWLDAEGRVARYFGVVMDITERKQAEEALIQSEAHRTLALDAAKAGTWEWDLLTNKNVWSAALWKLYGLDPHSREPTYEAWRESVHPEDLEPVEESLRKAVEQEQELRLEWRVKHAAEVTQWLMSRGRPLRDASGHVTRYIGVVMDITERKAHEAEIERLNRLYATLSQINQSIVRIKSREELAAEVSRVTITHGGFKFAWISCLNMQTGTPEPIGWAGEPRNLVQNLCHSMQNSDRHQCLCALAMQENHSCVLNNVSAAPQVREWFSALEQAGIRAAAVFPIRAGSVIWGVFGVYACEPDIFQDKEIALLEEAAADIGYAIEYLDNKEQREQAEQNLREQDKLLRQMSHMAHIGGWEFDPATGRGSWTEEVARIYDHDRTADTTVQLGLSVFQGESRQKIEVAIRDVIEKGTPYDLELELVTAKGNHKWVRTIGSADRIGDRVVKVHGAMQDISERIRVQNKLIQSQAALTQAGLMAHLGAWTIEVVDPENMSRNSLIWSDEVYRIFGYSPGSVEVTRALFFEHVHPADRENVARQLQRAITNQLQYQVEHRIVRADRSERVVLEHAEMLYNSQGKLLRILGAVQDITERKRLEEERIAMEAQMRQR